MVSPVFMVSQKQDTQNSKWPERRMIELYHVTCVMELSMLLAPLNLLMKTDVAS